MVFFAVLCCSPNILADNVLSVEPFTIDSYDVVNVPVALDNSDAITQIQFDVKLPDCLEISGTPVKNGERLTQHQVSFTPSNGRVLIYNIQGKAIRGNQGTLLTLPVKVKDGMLESGVVTMTLDDIVMTTPAAQGIYQPAVETEVTLFNEESPRGHLYTDTQELYINPGLTQTLTISLSNNFNVYGVQFDITLPDGFTIDPDTYVTSSRCSEESFSTLTSPETGVYRFLLTGVTRDPLVAAGEGELVSVTIKAPADFSAATATVTVSTVILSNVVGDKVKGVYGDGFTVKLMNGKTNLDAAEAEVARLRAELASALELIAKDYPDVKDQFKGEEISTSIDNLASKIQEAYDNGSLSTNYDEVMAPVAGIEDAIKALVPAAKAAQDAFNEANRVAANQQAYEAVVSALDALQTYIDETKAEIEKAYPGVDISKFVEQAEAALAEQRKAAEEALKAVETEGTFAYEVKPEPIKEALEEGRHEAERQTGNQKAYNDVLNTLNGYQKLVDDTKKEIETKYPDADVAALIEVAQAAIDAQRKAAEEAFKAVAEKGVFDYKANPAPIEEALKAAQAEAGRQDANLKAYNEVVNTLNGLQQYINDNKASLAANYPDVDVTAEIAAAQAALDAQVTAAAKAYEAVATEGTFEFVVNPEPIQKAIEEAVEKAKRISANGQSYDDVLKALDALQAYIDEQTKEIKTNYPEANVDAQIAAAQAALDAQRKAAEEAYKALGDGDVFKFAVDRTPVETAMKEAKAEAERQTANLKAYNEVLTSLNELQQYIDDNKKTLATDYPDIDVTAEMEAAQAALDTQVAAAAKAFEAVAAEGTFEFEVDPEPIKKAVEEAVAKALRIATNKLAYEVVLTALDALQAYIDEKVETIETDFPGVDISAFVKKAEDSIAEQRAAAEKAYEAVAEEGTFKFEVDRKPVEDAMAEAREDAARQAANIAAYKAVDAKIDELQDKFDEVIAKVATEYPSASVTAEILYAQKAIDKARAEAKDALDAVATEGTYDYTLDYDGIMALIDTILEHAGIDDITVDNLPVDAIMFDLKGNRVKNPTAGTAVIVKLSNGGTYKMIAK